MTRATARAATPTARTTTARTTTARDARRPARRRRPRAARLGPPAGRCPPGRSCAWCRRCRPAPGGGSLRRFGSGRAPFVLLVVALLVGTTLGLLILNTAIAVDSLKATQLRAANAERAQKVQSLEQQVVAGGTPERIAAAAAAAGLVPAGPAAFLVIAPDGSSTLRGTPEPAAAPPAPATPSPAAKSPATQSPPRQARRAVAGRAVAGRAVAGRAVAHVSVACLPVAGGLSVSSTSRGPEPAPAPAAARPPSAPLRSEVARVPSFPAARRAPGAAARACRWTSADCATAGA